MTYSKDEILEELNRVKEEQNITGTYKKYAPFLYAAAGIVLLLILLVALPSVKVTNDSMYPSIRSGTTVLIKKQSSYKDGDIVAIRYNDNVIIRRIICSEFETFDIDASGHVYVNNTLLNEDYIMEYSYGNNNILLPYAVEEGKYFVLADQRTNALDSRNSAFGTVSSSSIIGKVTMTIWPLNALKFH